MSKWPNVCFYFTQLSLESLNLDLQIQGVGGLTSLSEWVLTSFSGSEVHCASLVIDLSVYRGDSCTLEYLCCIWFGLLTAKTVLWFF